MNKAVEEYRLRIFSKLNLKSIKGLKILDLGCGEGNDSLYFVKQGAFVTGVDQLKSPQWEKFEKKYDRIKFIQGNAENLALPASSFDLIFAKDVLHHTDNPVKFLATALKLTKKMGLVVSLEANRYNPLFYFHMTLLLNHQHFTKKYFKKIVAAVKKENQVEFKQFEAHVFPFPFWLRKILYYLEDLVEKIPILKPFLAYNCYVIKKI